VDFFDLEFSVECPFEDDQISLFKSSLERAIKSVVNTTETETKVVVTILNDVRCLSRRNQRALLSSETIKAVAEIYLMSFEPPIVLPVKSDTLTMIEAKAAYIYDEVFAQSNITIANMSISIIENPSSSPSVGPSIEPSIEPSLIPSQKPTTSVVPSYSVSTATPSPLSAQPTALLSTELSQSPTDSIIESHDVEVTYILGFRFNPPEPLYDASTLMDPNVYGNVMDSVKLAICNTLLPQSNYSSVEGHTRRLGTFITDIDPMTSIVHKSITDVLPCPAGFESSNTCVEVVTDIAVEINLIKIGTNEVKTTLARLLKDVISSPEFIHRLNDTDIVQVQYEESEHIGAKKDPSTNMIIIIASSSVIGIGAIIFGIRRYRRSCFQKSSSEDWKTISHIKSQDFCADDEKLGRTTYYERQTAPPFDEVYQSSRPVSAMTNITSAVSRLSYSVSPIISELKTKKRSLEMRFSSLFSSNDSPHDTNTRVTSRSAGTHRRSRQSHQRRTPQTESSSTKS